VPVLKPTILIAAMDSTRDLEKLPRQGGARVVEKLLLQYAGLASNQERTSFMGAS